MKFKNNKLKETRQLKAALFDLEDSPDQCLCIAMGGNCCWMYKDSEANYVDNNSLESYPKLHEAIALFYEGDEITIVF